MVEMGSFEAALESAWRDFREVLAGRMESMRPGERVVIHQRGEEEDRRPYVVLTRTGEEVLVRVSGNGAVEPVHRLPRSALAELRGLGLTPVRAKGYCATFPVSHVDQAAAVAVAALRGPLGVVHPAMLASEDPVLTPEPRPGSPEAWGDAVIRPLSPDHLGHVVVGTLTAMLGREPRRDSDGDLVITRGRAVVFVRCHPGRPLVQVFGHLAVEVRDAAAADAEVARLNQQLELLKLVNADGAVFVSVDLPAAPFVPAHLKAVVGHMLHVIAGEQDRLASAVGGRTFLGEPAQTTDEDEVHPVMARYLQLDALEPGSVTPQEMARLCEHDDDLILRLIRWAEAREHEWTDARDDALGMERQSEADSYAPELDRYARTITLLRRTLHLVLLGESA